MEPKEEKAGISTQALIHPNGVSGPTTKRDVYSCLFKILRETLATGEHSIGQAEAVKETPKDRPRAPNS